jgi:hypothetical protein
MRKSKDWVEILDLAEDNFPGTGFDGIFKDLTEAWITAHEGEPHYWKEIRNPVMRKMAQTSQKFHDGMSKEQKQFIHKFAKERADANDRWLREIGADLADAVVKGDSAFLRQTADALDQWTNHQPSEDKLRTAILYLTGRRRCKLPPISMREILAALPRLGYPFPDDAEGKANMANRVRELAKELGESDSISGKTGRPRK